MSVINRHLQGKIKGIPTVFNGVEFKSRMESNVAKLLYDLLGEMPEYEPQSFLLPDGTHYCPDFRVTGLASELWVECRGYKGKESQFGQFALPDPELEEYDDQRRLLVFHEDSVVFYSGDQCGQDEPVIHRCSGCGKLDVFFRVGQFTDKMGYSPCSGCGTSMELGGDQFTFELTMKAGKPKVVMAKIQLVQEIWRGDENYDARRLVSSPHLKYNEDAHWQECRGCGKTTIITKPFGEHWPYLNESSADGSKWEGEFCSTECNHKVYPPTEEWLRLLAARKKQEQ